MTGRLPPLAWDAGEQLDPRRVEPLGEGDFTTCLLLDGDLVLRLAKHAAASASIAREIELLPRLEGRLPVAIPRVVGHGRRADTGERFLVYPRVPGTPLSPPVLARLDAGARAAILRSLAEFARALHALPAAIGDAAGLERVDPRWALPAVLEDARHRIAPRLAPAVWRYHERLLERYLDDPRLHAFEPALLHGDLSPWHALADLDRATLSGVIDFGDAFVGDPWRDLIFFLEDGGPEMLDAFLETYAPGDDRAAERVRIHQQLDNVAYGLTALDEGDERKVAAALETLAAQAGPSG